MNFPAVIDFGENGGKRRFDNEQSVLTLLDEERNAWNFIQTIRQDSPAYSLRQLYDSTIGGSENFRRQAYMNNRNSTAIDPVFNNIQQNLPRSKFPTSFSKRGQLIKQIQSQYGDEFTIGYMAGLLDLHFDAGSPAQLEGMLLARDLANATARRAKTALQKSFQGFLNRADEHQAKLEEAFNQVAADGAEAEERRVVRSEQAALEAKETLDRTVDETTEKINRAIENINATEEIYKAFMTLKGPVTYWQNKATIHRRNSLVSQAVGLVYALTLVIYLIHWGATLLVSTVEAAIKETHEWQISYVILAVALVLLTIVFWIGRLISRLYVSEQHLAVDADERATMVMTYLALANDNKVSEAERAIVLASLFRPSADGLVRDDGAPDLSLASLLSKYVAPSK